MQCKTFMVYWQFSLCKTSNIHRHAINLVCMCRERFLELPLILMQLGPQTFLLMLSYQVLMLLVSIVQAFDGADIAVTTAQLAS